MKWALIVGGSLMIAATIRFGPVADGDVASARDGSLAGRLPQPRVAAMVTAAHSNTNRRPKGHSRVVFPWLSIGRRPAQPIAVSRPRRSPICSRDRDRP